MNRLIILSHDTASKIGLINVTITAAQDDVPYMARNVAFSIDV